MDEQTVQTEELQEAAVSLASVLLGAGLGFVGGVLVAAVIVSILRWLFRRHRAAPHLIRRCRKPFAVAGGVLGMRGGLAIAMPPEESVAWVDMVRHGLMIAFVLCLMWLAIALISAAEEAALEHFDADTVARGSRARRVQTQAQILNRVAVVVVIAVGISAILLTFPAARTVGASILASAGIASLVVGLAAQSVLGNVFAGLQIAFTDSLRIDDTVSVEGELGNVEEMTLTYVVVRTWDERRLILPSTHFTTTPFLNYTKTDASLTGTVELDVDWSVPIAAVRAEAVRLAHACEDFDGRSVNLTVTDAISGVVRLRVLVSAADNGALWNVRTFVREGLVEWLQANASYAVSKQHMMMHEPPASWEAMDPADLAMLEEEAHELNEAVTQERQGNTFDRDLRAIRQGSTSRPGETTRMMARAARRRADKADRRRAKLKPGALGRQDGTAFLAEPSSDTTRVLSGMPGPQELPEAPPHGEETPTTAHYGAVPAPQEEWRGAAMADGAPQRHSLRARIAHLGQRVQAEDQSKASESAARETAGQDAPDKSDKPDMPDKSDMPDNDGQSHRRAARTTSEGDNDGR